MMRTSFVRVFCGAALGGLCACGTGNSASPTTSPDASVSIVEDFLDATSNDSSSLDAFIADANEAAAPIDAGRVDAGDPTFANVYAQIINGGASPCSECHVPDGSGNLDLSSQTIAFTNLVSKPATNAPLCASQTDLLVDPGNAEKSLTYLKVTAPPCGQQMPLGGPYLTIAQIQLIGDWINAGAMNN